MKCARHNTKMVKDKKTGLESCMICDKVDIVMDELHNIGEWEYDVKDVESYLRGPDTAGIDDLLSKKREKEGNE